MHFRRPPVESTINLVAKAPLTKLETGTRATVEVIAYPDGQFRLVTSHVSGPGNSRRIRQAGFLMFRDADETKDALDLLVDRLSQSAVVEAGPEEMPSVSPSTVDVAARGVRVATEELRRRGCRVDSDTSLRSKNLLVAMTPQGRRVQVYVKSKRSGDWQSDASRAAPRDRDPEEALYWVLVDLGVDPPSFRIIPNWWMENDIYATHQEYFSQLGSERAQKPGSKHHAIRPQNVAEWLERWDQLGI